MREYTPEEINQRFQLLDQYERRCIIRFLQDAETDPVSVCEVVNHLQKQDPTPDQHDKLAIALRHRHLPKLAGADALEFDSDSETVRYNSDELVETLLEVTPERHVSDN